MKTSYKIQKFNNPYTYPYCYGKEAKYVHKVLAGFLEKRIIFIKYSLKYLLFLLIVSSINTSIAQWVRTNGPYFEDVRCFALEGSNLFAGTYGGIFISSNNGTNWTAINTGLANTHITSLAVNNKELFAGTIGGGVFLSTNYGTNWTEVNNGLMNKYVNTILTLDTNLFV